MVVAINGELREFHKVTLDFAGPNRTETAATFTNHRLDVTFTKGAERIVVPGYFAADGDAADTSPTSGGVWRVHFAPPDDGTWTWSASFRTGTNVADDSAPGGGASGGFMDGETGSLTIGRTDKTGDDFRAKGFMRYVGDNHYVFSGNGEHYLKGGIGSPENFLAYKDFDGTAATHAYAPHLGDWRAGDPTWHGGEGKAIIGAINAAADYGMNALYFLTMNVGGDGDDVWPWVSRTARTTYDVSKLDQWGVVMDHMTKRGVMIHIVHQEQENDQLLNGGALGVERKVYYREMVARFGHNPALQWNLGEENTNTDAERKAFAIYIKAIDPYDHPIVVHTQLEAQESRYRPLMGFDATDGASLQTFDPHGQAIEWLDRSNATDQPWVVSMDEIAYRNRDGTQDHHTGTPPDSVDPGHDAIRKDYLWGNLMAGGGGIEYYFAKWGGDGDRDTEQFDSRAGMWRQSNIALDFFRKYLPFWDMRHADGLTPAADDYVFAMAGAVYAVYLPEGGTTTLDLSGQRGTYEVKWHGHLALVSRQRVGVRVLQAGEAVVVGPGERAVVVVVRHLPHRADFLGGGDRIGAEVLI